MRARQYRVAVEEKVDDDGQDPEAPQHTTDPLAGAAPEHRGRSASAVPPLRARRRSSLSNAVSEFNWGGALVVDDAAQSARDDDPDRRGSMVDDVREALDDYIRRLSATLGGQQPRVGRSELHRDFDALLERLDRDGMRQPDAVARVMSVWQVETFGRVTDPLARLRCRPCEVSEVK